jgi:16S rRNA (cytosine967-C5)-methyltransferase
VSDPIRALAADVVGRVLRSGAYSNVLADQVGARLEPAERARLKALVFGTLRHLEVIDERILATADRDRIDPQVMDRLRIAGFELLYGELPDPIAVSAGVDLVRAARPKAAGFANAVLRRMAGSKSPIEEALRLPDWLVGSLTAAWGEQKVKAFALASAGEPERVGRSRSDASPGFAGVPAAVELPPGPVPEDVVIQDAASIAVGTAVEAAPGMTVLDMCAAPGGKTLHLLDQMGEEGLVVAMDSHLRRVRNAAVRVPGARWLVGDAIQPPLPHRRFDRVLLDAPCSGLGTLRRRPEIRLRVDRSEVARLAGVQRRMLEAALQLVAPEGLLVYSVCTVTPEETVDVVEGHDFRPADLPGVIWGKGRLLAPHLTSTDGMFVAIHQS